MSTTTTVSTYFFIGKLSDHTLRFQVQEQPLPNGFFLEVYLDGICIWGSTAKEFAEIFAEAKEAFNIIVSAFVFKTQRALGFTIENWVEAKGVSSTSNVIGWLIPPHHDIQVVSQRSSNNTAWKRAAWFYSNVSRGNAHHRLALKEYRLALTDTSEDAFLFAYRAIEDTCRAITGADEITKSDWTKMHSTIGTNKQLIDPLLEVAIQVRHGDIHDPIVRQAMANRSAMIRIAHQVMEGEFHRTFPKF